MPHILSLYPEHILYPDHSRGQNFLIDKNVLAKIVAAGELTPQDTVVEIGAGLGVLERKHTKSDTVKNQEFIKNEKIYKNLLSQEYL